MWYKVRPAQRCVISVQRCFSCCVTTGSFSFISRVGCCSLQTSSCPQLPGVAPAVGAVCCISWNKCRLWQLQRGCSPAEPCRAFPFKVCCCCCSAGSGNPLPLPARTVCCFCADAASWNCINSCMLRLIVGCVPLFLPLWFCYIALNFLFSKQDFYNWPDESFEEMDSTLAVQQVLLLTWNVVNDCSFVFWYIKLNRAWYLSA